MDCGSDHMMSRTTMDSMAEGRMKMDISSKKHRKNKHAKEMVDRAKNRHAMRMKY